MDSQKTYTELLRRHRSLVWTLCWSRSRGDYERCRDLVQEVSLSLWEHYGRLRPDTGPLQERAWVVWHTRSVLDHLHRRPSPTLVPLTDDIAAESDDTSETVDELLASLSDADRRLVQLRLEGYDGDYIARELGVKRDVVYQRLHRIIEKLRTDNNEKQRHKPID